MMDDDLPQIHDEASPTPVWIPIIGVLILVEDLRRDRDRRRPRRLRGRHPPRAAQAEDAGDREGVLGRRVPQLGLHPQQGPHRGANFVERARKQSATMGITVSGVSVDAAKMQAWKNGIVKKLTDRRAGPAPGNGAEMLKGTARLVDANTVEVETAEGKVQPSRREGHHRRDGHAGGGAPGLRLRRQEVISAKEGVSLNPLPKRIAIIGGGIIGMELGGVYSKLGVER
jgi:dihydrolipoamide dehydrogenase